MEWTWRQQLFMLLQSGGVGFLLGVLYDVFVTVGRVRRFTRSAVFVSDVLFGITAGFVTFFFSLSAMDGRLHPLLFAGCGGGFAVEHLGISRLLCRTLYRAAALFHKVFRCFIRLLCKPLTALFSLCGCLVNKICDKMRKIKKKSSKKFLFFQKNS